MSRFKPLLILMSLFGAIAVGAQENYWQQAVHYTMDVTLLPLEHALIGDETIIYRNNSPDSIRQFYLHLYPNAFRDSESIMAKEARHFRRTLLANPEDGGYLKIESFKITMTDSSNDAAAVTAFRVEDTILAADLPQPLAPGQELKVELSFYHKVRKFEGRAGYRGFQYDFAQWYPKVCVYDEAGWNAEPFHFQGEFYGEFGTFDVRMTLPFEYIVGATGEVTAGDPGWRLVTVDSSWSDSKWREERQEMKKVLQKGAASGEMREVTFHAEHVHDFAWSASTDFVYETGNWDGVPIHVLYRSYGRPRWSKRAVERAARALAWLSEKFRRYPYPQLTVIHGLLSGGMEYPTLVMNGNPSESLMLHEVGHIYFYGILANNEWKEAWLDEGFTSFQTRWYMETRYGDWGFDRQAQLQRAGLLQRMRPGKTLRERNRDATLAYISSGHDAPIATPAHEFREPLAYRRNAYDKGAFFFDMLRYVVGEEAFDEICREYFRRWAFKHVNESRFRAVCEEVSGMGLAWFFEQWLHDTEIIDYKLGKVEQVRTNDYWQTDVEIMKKTDGIMPVDVQVTTPSGDTLVQRWDGVEDTGKVTFMTTLPPDNVVIDPNDEILDYTRFDNGGTQALFMFEYPNMSYAPRNRYLITWRPSVWGNDVDGFRLGGRLRGKQAMFKNAEIGLWLGIDSFHLDGRLRYASRIPALGARTRGSLLLQKMEGRFEIDSHLQFIKARNLVYASQYRFWVGFNHKKLLDGEYTLRDYDRAETFTVQTWEPGIINKAYFRFAVNPRGMRWITNLTLGFDTVQKDWGSSFTYNSAFSELKASWPSRSRGLFGRFYAKKILQSEETPVQDMIYLDGANPTARFTKFYLRSHGSLDESLHYHMPGGGNLRGFFNNPIYGTQILALNLEYRAGFSDGWIGAHLLRHATFVLFSDFASLKVRNATKEHYTDAGFGFRFNTVLEDEWYTIFTAGRDLTLRLDFPIWVSKNLPEENNFAFRWLFGFEQTF